jgi:hypothetical protein
MFHAWQAVASKLGGIGRLSPLDGPNGADTRRGEMVRMLSFLGAAGIGGEVLARLALGLEELDRGVSIPELERRKRQGRKAPTKNLPLMKIAVEAADAIAVWACHDRVAVDRELGECGTYRWAVESWRTILESGPSQYRPRKFSLLAWGAPDHLARSETENAMLESGDKKLDPDQQRHRLAKRVLTEVVAALGEE